eukprot:8161327-Prorocentrum_lima.AAC.1
MQNLTPAGRATARPEQGPVAHGRCPACSKLLSIERLSVGQILCPSCINQQRFDEVASCDDNPCNASVRGKSSACRTPPAMTIEVLGAGIPCRAMASWHAGVPASERRGR